MILKQILHFPTFLFRLFYLFPVSPPPSPSLQLLHRCVLSRHTSAFILSIMFFLISFLTNSSLSPSSKKKSFAISSFRTVFSQIKSDFPQLRSTSPQKVHSCQKSRLLILHITSVKNEVSTFARYQEVKELQRNFPFYMKCVSEKLRHLQPPQPHRENHVKVWKTHRYDGMSFDDFNLDSSFWGKGLK